MKSVKILVEKIHHKWARCLETLSCFTQLVQVCAGGWMLVSVPRWGGQRGGPDLQAPSQPLFLQNKLLVAKSAALKG